MTTKSKSRAPFVDPMFVFYHLKDKAGYSLVVETTSYDNNNINMCTG